MISDDALKFLIEYVFAYRIGGFWDVMLTWLTNDVMLSSDENDFRNIFIISMVLALIGLYVCF